MRLTIKLGKARGKPCIGATVELTRGDRPCSVREENFMYHAEQAAHEAFSSILCELDNCKFKIILQTNKVCKDDVKGKLIYQHSRGCPKEIYDLGMAYYHVIKEAMEE